MKIKNLLLCACAALVLFAGCAPKTPEVKCKVWLNWPERYLPDFSTLGEPDMEVSKINFDLVDLPDTNNHFAVLFETTLKVCKAEEYTFKISSDDGTKFYIDGEMLIENDGAHGPILKLATKQLEKGVHDLRLEFFDYDKGQALDFKYSTPTIPERPFNPEVEAIEERSARRSDFVIPQTEEALKRYKEWKGDDVVMNFPIFTDIHTAGRYSYRHLGFASEIASRFESDFAANLGDIGLNAYPATIDAAYAKKVLENTRAEMDKFDGIWLYAAGNHDWDAGEGEYLSEEFLTDFFQKPWQEKAGENLHLTPGKVYGYYDIPAKGMRIIFINSQGTGTQGGFYYYFDPAQMEWLQSLLDSTDKDTAVLVLVHYTPHPNGRWNGIKTAEYTVEANQRLLDILADYKTRGTLVGLVSGDSHFNMHEVDRGVDYYTAQGYGWVTNELLMPRTTHEYFNYKETLCVDVVAVKPEKHEVHTFRIGAGGSQYDYEFTY